MYMYCISLLYCRTYTYIRTYIAHIHCNAHACVQCITCAVYTCSVCMQCVCMGACMRVLFMNCLSLLCSWRRLRGLFTRLIWIVLHCMIRQRRYSLFSTLTHTTAELVYKSIIKFCTVCMFLWSNHCKGIVRSSI